MIHASLWALIFTACIWENQSTHSQDSHSQEYDNSQSAKLEDTSFSMELGIQHSVKAVRLYGGVGYQFWSIHRKDQDCYNCEPTSADLEASPFASFHIGYDIGGPGFLYAGYRSYLSEDIEGTISIGIGFSS